MPLEYNELEPIIAEALEKVRVEIIKANRMGTLDLILDKYGVEANVEAMMPSTRTADTVLILGDLSISKDDLSNLLRRFKISENNCEFVEYDNVTNFNFAKLMSVLTTNVCL